MEERVDFRTATDSTGNNINIKYMMYSTNRVRVYCRLFVAHNSSKAQDEHAARSLFFW